MGVVKGRRHADSVRQAMVTQLRDAILSGKYAWGQKLPTLRELAKVYHTSHTNVGGALDIICREGLLTKRQGSGFYLRRALDPEPDALRVFATHRLDHGFVALLAKFRDKHPEVSLFECARMEDADVALLGCSDTAFEAANGRLLPLDEMLKKSGLDPEAFHPGALELGRSAAGICALPLQFSVEAIFCNLRLLPEAEVWHPGSLDDFLAFVRQHAPGLAAKRLKVLAYSHGFMSQVLPLLELFGGGVVDGKGRPAVFHRGPNLAATNYARALIRAMPGEPESFSPSKAFIHDRAALLRCPVGFWSRLWQMKKPDIRVLPMGAGKSGREAVNGLWMAMPSRCRNPELAWRLIRELSSSKAHLELVRAGILFPARQDAITATCNACPAVAAAFAEALPERRFWIPEVSHQNLLCLDSLFHGWLGAAADELPEFLAKVSARWRRHLNSAGRQVEAEYPGGA